MKEYIVPLDEEEAFYGYKDVAKELIRCKDCRFFDTGQNECETWNTCLAHINRPFETFEDGYCSWAERKEGTDENR